MNFKDISYLKSGNKKQIRLYESLSKNKILVKLKKFSPILVSTICVDLALDNSDVDIICETTKFSDFKEVIAINFNNFSKLKYHEKKDFCTASFMRDNFLFEIYCSKIPVEQQNGYVHFCVMHKIINLGGKELKDKIISLKKLGFKTEPAISKVLSLKGNPYQAVYDLNNLKEEELKKIIISKKSLH